MEAEKRRYAGIDLGKREYTMAIISKAGKMSIHHGKTHAEGRAALYRQLEKTDKVALEAGNLAFIMARGRAGVPGTKFCKTAFIPKKQFKRR